MTDAELDEIETEARTGIDAVGALTNDQCMALIAEVRRLRAKAVLANRLIEAEGVLASAERDAVDAAVLRRLGECRGCEARPAHLMVGSCGDCTRLEGAFLDAAEAHMAAYSAWKDAP